MTINAQVEGEHGSIVTMYYAFSKGASMGMAPGGKPRTSEGTYQAWMSKELPYALSPDLIQVLNDSVLSNGDKINGAQTPKGTIPWVNTWVNQTLEIGKYIGQNVNVSDKDNSSGDNKWLYGMFGKNPRKDDTTIPGIPNQLVSTALQCVWDVYSDLDDESLNEVVGFIKDKEFSKMRKWVALNIHNDPQAIYRKIYDALFTRMENSSIPQAIIILSDYTYKSAFVADQEVNMVACMTELMMECKLN